MTFDMTFDKRFVGVSIYSDGLKWQGDERRRHSARMSGYRELFELPCEYMFGEHCMWLTAASMDN